MANGSIYEKIRSYRTEIMMAGLDSNTTLAKLNNTIMEQVVWLAIEKVAQELGPAPSPFSFFVLGSAGRCEQGIWSDQDHGLIFVDGGENVKGYFLTLGREITEGLTEVGYPKCDGNVMASNPMWCHSLAHWQNQVEYWTEEASWETIRHLLTFLDSRSLAGNEDLLGELKRVVFHSIHQKQLLPRIINNTMHIKKGVGVLGQLLVETHGPFTGMINIKETGLLPYINSARILAIHEEIAETSTIGRFRRLPDSILSASERIYYECRFSKLLDFRLAFGGHENYEAEHYLHPGKLTKDQKKELRAILLDGVHLFEKVRKLIEKESRHGNE
ncbi:DUF294 nucleotidyltransferase-like domain-containing protein [Bacillus sp. EB01]|uniref:DUF294 nucleotidyltransferase-like domain-containing protein n=1 Tax=Bacillus sp. EB01 TaxID=1347086 RepID=UPI0005C59DAC|nr:DUF294 nucleotidyltransferase-like domain-containing protein [Bacillus sp. EB01]